MVTWKVDWDKVALGERAAVGRRLTMAWTGHRPVSIHCLAEEESWEHGGFFFFLFFFSSLESMGRTMFLVLSSSAGDTQLSRMPSPIVPDSWIHPKCHVC